MVPLKTTISTMNAKVNPYQAVSIQPSLCACRAAQSLADKRYLCREAPVFPLVDCNKGGECECKYKRWEDRRQEDRRAPFATAGDQYFAHGNRRDSNDRRIRDPSVSAPVSAPTSTAKPSIVNKSWGLKSFIQSGLGGVLGQNRG
jgi:hypothetical protein